LPTCKEMVTANYSKRVIRCLKCKGKVTLFNHPSLSVEDSNSEVIFDWGGSALDDEGDFILYDTKYLCPKCGKMNMEFSDLGSWD